MCGIAGIFHNNKIQEVDVDTVERINQIQKHRGPDDEGIYYDQSCVLGHRRLSIIDLSKDGHQPFESEDRRFKLVFNGEIYNYIELRNELKSLGYEFKTQTDTEVLLKAYQEFSDGCLKKLNGMFAFAIYDEHKKTLFLARDHVGIKPLYYCFIDSKFVFASEIKAFQALPSFKPTVNNQSIFDYLVFNRTDIYDETFFNEVHRLPKGHKATLRNGQLSIRQWWNPEDFINCRRGEDEHTILQTIDELMVSSTKMQLRSDVKVGSCLSGGLDSSILTGALYAHNNMKDYNTFTVTFPNTSIDESKYVDLFNQKYAFINHRTTPTADDAFENLKNFVYMQDEPTPGATVYSQYALMKLAREKGISVLLDGQGGDENFAGYHYFHGFYLYGLWRSRKMKPFIGNFLNTLFRGQDKTAFQTFIFQTLSDKDRKKVLYKTVPFMTREFFNEYIGKSKIYNKFFDADNLSISLLRHFQYKLEHLLRFEDRNSMAHSIEARVPYLDPRLIEYLLGLNEDIKIKSGETKYLQKQALGKYTIDEILNRKDKLGFSTPMDEWMKTKSWSKLSQENYCQLKYDSPTIFNQKSSLPTQGAMRWKINQLAVWKDTFLN